MSKEKDDNQEQEVLRGRLADVDLSDNIIISSAALADLIRRMEAVEAYIGGRDDPEWGPCTRCGYGPFRRPRRPICCPKCHSAYWDREPKNVSARKPGDPPARSWTNRGNGRRAETKPSRPAASSAKRPVALPPELRPPGDELIPPPPRVVAIPGSVEAARTTDNPMNVRPVSLSEQLAERTQPIEHVAPMPDEIVERVVAGEEVGYEDIKAAKESDEASAGRPVEERVHERDNAEGQLPDNWNQRPVDPALQAKKDSFFADAIQAGLVSPVVEGEATKDEAPFVAPGMAAEIDAKKKDDPFWK